MASSLSNLVNNLSEGSHIIKCKYRHNDKKCETCGKIKYKYCECVLDDFIECKSFCCKNSYQQKFDEKS